MSTKKMLIDASHPEETRVAVLQNGKVEDFDFESLSRKPLRGNIYLARITRVEPSLQAAFVEYGGNRHGFLAFNEIHPDYYQIPVSDREVLRKAEALEAELAEALEALEAHEEGEVEPDLNEEDDGLRAVDAEVPDASDVPEDEAEDDGASAEDDATEANVSATEDGSDDDGDAVRVAAPGPEVLGDASDDEDADPREEEEEEEEREAADEDPEAADASDAEADGSDEAVPADYAGEDSAEDAGWHAIEEEEIAALPKEEAERTPEADDLTDEEAAAADGERGADDEASGEADGGDAVAAAAATEVIEADADEAETDAADGDEDTETEGAARRRRRRRGGRGRRKKAQAEDGANDAEASEDEARADRADEDEDGDGDAEEAAPKRKPKAKADDPRAKEIAELRRRYEDAKRERAKLLRNYRIQEVIKRRQILLVQAVKEERGNKGAALTTYLSLAGRYGVLMPNTARGGGVSRKITNTSDRKRLRAAMSEMEIPQGQGLIIRTAGAKRTKAEIKRDYEYLSRLWGTIREKTLESVAPCLIYEEASLIKRAIRDLYDKDTEMVSVQGEEGYREAKDFMKMIMPSHAKNVQRYKERVPLFARYGVEQQIDEMFTPTVKLKSGGYIVIQQTEALVSIDVNSGRATKERNVEQTALKTNLEAAHEAARQCRLRDLAGLVVIDFIDMEERSNNRKVEKALKDAMKTDRARIQLGSISGFGLLEFSRQRRRAGIVDGTTKLCPLCDGAGAVRSDEMAAMRILRAVEAEAMKGRAGLIEVTAAPSVALHVLNAKRSWLARIEGDYGVTVSVGTDVHKNGDQYEMQTSGEPSAPQETLRQEIREELATLDDEPSDEAADEAKADGAAGDDASGDAKPRRRRRGGRGRRRSDAQDGEQDGSQEGSAEAEEARAETPEAEASDDAKPEGSPTEAAETAGEKNASDAETVHADADGDDDDKPKRRRRGRRGGRRNRKKADDADGAEAQEADGQSDGNDDASMGTEGDAEVPSDDGAPVSSADTPDDPDAQATEAPEVQAADAAEADGPVLAEDGAAVTESYTDVEPTQEDTPATDAEAPVSAANGEAVSETDEPDEPAAKSPPEDIVPEGPKRGGWWQRALGR